MDSTLAQMLSLQNSMQDMLKQFQQTTQAELTAERTNQSQTQLSYMTAQQEITRLRTGVQVSENVQAIGDRMTVQLDTKRHVVQQLPSTPATVPAVATSTRTYLLEVLPLD